MIGPTLMIQKLWHAATPAQLSAKFGSTHHSVCLTTPANYPVVFSRHASNPPVRRWHPRCVIAFNYRLLVTSPLSELKIVILRIFGGRFVERVSSYLKTI
jgi:hypothetical protein